MKSWEKLEEGSDGSRSFANLFQTEFQPPPEAPSASSMKTLTIDEIHSSGPSLRTLSELNVEQLTLGQGYNYSWAMESLSAYGPRGFEQTWDPLGIQMDIGDQIAGEPDVSRYLEHVFLTRVLCGGFFLYSLAQPEPNNEIGCPGRQSCRIDDRSTTGPGGWPDREISYRQNNCCLVEFKTYRVCCSQGEDILDIDSRDGGLLYGEAYSDDWFYGLSPLNKKKNSLIYQVRWFPGDIFVSLIILESPGHQLLSRSCKHTIVANQNHFFLAIRRKNSLSISKKYHFSEPAASLRDLSFFIAHSFYERHSSGVFSPAEAPKKGPSVRHSNSGDSSPPSGGRMHHQRSDSSKTVTGPAYTNYMDSFTNRRIIIALFNVCTSVK